VKDITVKVAITAVAVTLAVVRLVWPDLRVDAVCLALLVVAALPWSYGFLESAEFLGVGRVTFRRLEEDVSTLKFLVAHFLTDDELIHLRKLADEAPFPFEKLSSFEQELRHLRALRFIKPRMDKGIRALFAEGKDVGDYFRITERGRQYLRLRLEMGDDMGAGAD
jgi:hypothetical protein